MAGTTRAEPGKDQRLYIRVSEDQKWLLEEAAKTSRISMSQFVLREALTSAEQVVADQTLIRLPQAEYDEFLKRIDEAPKQIPALRRLAEEPSIFTDE
jgi:uncharacterized protein (DUF1778 family)